MSPCPTGGLVGVYSYGRLVDSFARNSVLAAGGNVGRLVARIRKGKVDIYNSYASLRLDEDRVGDFYDGGGVINTVTGGAVSTPQELQDISSLGEYRLENDINLARFNWEPIEGFIRMVFF